MTLNEIVQTTIQTRRGELEKIIEMNRAMTEMLKALPPHKPLTRYERLQLRLQDIRDGLRVMRGEASYIEWCGE